MTTDCATSEVIPWSGLAVSADDEGASGLGVRQEQEGAVDAETVMRARAFAQLVDSGFVEQPEVTLGRLVAGQEEYGFSVDLDDLPCLQALRSHRLAVDDQPAGLPRIFGVDEFAGRRAGRSTGDQLDPGRVALFVE